MKRNPENATRWENWRAAATRIYTDHDKKRGFVRIREDDPFEAEIKIDAEVRQTISDTKNQVLIGPESTWLSKQIKERYSTDRSEREEHGILSRAREVVVQNFEASRSRDENSRPLKLRPGDRMSRISREKAIAYGFLGDPAEADRARAIASQNPMSRRFDPTLERILSIEGKKVRGALYNWNGAMSDKFLDVTEFTLDQEDTPLQVAAAYLSRNTACFGGGQNIDLAEALFRDDADHEFEELYDGLRVGSTPEKELKKDDQCLALFWTDNSGEKPPRLFDAWHLKIGNDMGYGCEISVTESFSSTYYHHGLLYQPGTEPVLVRENSASSVDREKTPKNYKVQLFRLRQKPDPE